MRYFDEDGTLRRIRMPPKFLFALHEKACESLAKLAHPFQAFIEVSKFICNQIAHLNTFGTVLRSYQRGDLIQRKTKLLSLSYKTYAIDCRGREDSKTSSRAWGGGQKVTALVIPYRVNTDARTLGYLTNMKPILHH